MSNKRSVLEYICTRIKKMLFYTISSAAYPLYKLIIFLLPYCMYYLALKKPISEYLALIIPICFYLLSYILKLISDASGKGDITPVPSELFTTEIDGEVSVDRDRLSELLIFVNDYEKYLKRKGLL